MKTIITTLFLAVLVSCSKPETENTDISEANISGGTWTIQISTLDGEYHESSDTYQFTTDHKVFRTSKYGSVVDAGTYTLVNGELICEFTNPRTIHFRVMVKQINKTTLKWEAYNSLGFLEESFTR